MAKIEKLEWYTVKGAWVSEPFVTFDSAQMVMAEAARAREEALLEAAKESLAETDCGGECASGKSCAHYRLANVIRQIEATQ